LSNGPTPRKLPTLGRTIRPFAHNLRCVLSYRLLHDRLTEGCAIAFRGRSPFFWSRASISSGETLSNEPRYFTPKLRTRRFAWAAGNPHLARMQGTDIAELKKPRQRKEKAHRHESKSLPWCDSPRNLTKGRGTRKSLTPKSKGELHEEKSESCSEPPHSKMNITTGRSRLPCRIAWRFLDSYARWRIREGAKPCRRRAGGVPERRV
jgi:hypothetical protein